MECIRNNTEFLIPSESAVTLGKFDGFHRGHQKLIKKVKEFAKGNLHSVVFTFDVSPLIKLGNKVTKNILVNEERRTLLSKFNIDYLVEYPFNPEVIHMDAEEFIRKVLKEQLHAKYIIVGTDFGFGYQRRGNVKLLQEMAPKYDYEVIVVEKEKEGNRDISSTFVREELEKGDIPFVSSLLGYPFFVEGEILRGNQFGRTMGLPTINQIPEELKLLPPNGVYVSRTTIEEITYNGITNIGCKPTVNGEFIGVETHLFHCNQNLYGKNAVVELLKNTRPEKCFRGIEELKAQIEQDVLEGKAYFLDNCTKK